MKKLLILMQSLGITTAAVMPTLLTTDKEINNIQEDRYLVSIDKVDLTIPPEVASIIVQLSDLTNVLNRISSYDGVLQSIEISLTNHDQGVSSSWVVADEDIQELQSLLDKKIAINYVESIITNTSPYENYNKAYYNEGNVSAGHFNWLNADVDMNLFLTKNISYKYQIYFTAN